MLAAPAASCAKMESTRVSHHRQGRTTRRFLRNGFNGFLRGLPGDRAFLPPSQVTMRKHRHQVDTSVEISGRHDFAVRIPVTRQLTENVHRIPRPTSVTIAIRPSSRAQDAGRSARDLPDVASEIFCDKSTRRANQLARLAFLTVNSLCYFSPLRRRRCFRGAPTVSTFRLNFARRLTLILNESDGVETGNHRRLPAAPRYVKG